MRTITILHLTCQIGVVCRILLLCLIVRYMLNVFYLHYGLIMVSTSNSINIDNNIPHLITTTTNDPSTILLQHQQQLLTSAAKAAAVTSQSASMTTTTTTTIAESIQLVNTATWAKPSDRYIVNTMDLWEDNDDDNSSNNKSKILPQWMIQYFRWHKEQIMNISRTNPLQQNQQRYLYVTCLKEYHKCGGTADRLLSIPFLLKIAASTHRIIVIQWTKPSILENFLLPPLGGLDWRVYPDMMLLQQPDRSAKNNNNNNNNNNSIMKAGTEELIVEYSKLTNISVVQVKFQSHDHGSIYYDTYKETIHETIYDTVFHMVWNIFFTPTPVLAEQIRNTMEELQLLPYQYTSAHVRALYGVSTRDETMVQGWTQNAINCAIQIQQQSKDSTNTNEVPVVYFAADTNVALKHSKKYSQNFMVDVKSRIGQQQQQDHNPLHLDKTKNWHLRPPSDFYDIFIDLYIMGFSAGVSYGMGGYGKFASLLVPHDDNSKGNRSSIIHMSAVHIEHCKQPPRRKRMVGMHRYSKQKDKDKLGKKYPVSFVEPMPLAKMNHERQVHIIDPKQQTHSEPMEVLFPNMNSPRLPNLWDESQKLPNWMKEYFVWHQEQRKQLSKHNYENYKYIVMTCLLGDNKCGGTSDRLRPLPVVVRIAAQSKRILLIVWEKPAPLESFLVPPIGGVDWRVPNYMMEHLRTNSVPASTIARLVDVSMGKDAFVKARIQSNDHGSEYYNTIGAKAGEGPSALRQHYRDCWFSFFTPVSTIAAAIEKEMERMDLIPGEFAVAHLRSEYDLIQGSSRDDQRIRNWTISAVDCVSNLRPGGPYFFSSDSNDAKKVAFEYGQKRSVKVTSTSDNYEPIHLEAYSGKKDPGLFYSIFIDLYVMSFGRCYSYNVGGFAKWASLISGHNFKCNVRYWTDGVNQASVNKDGCKWAAPNTKKDSKSLPMTFERPLFLQPMDNVAKQRDQAIES